MTQRKRFILISSALAIIAAASGASGKNPAADLITAGDGARSAKNYDAAIKLYREVAAEKKYAGESRLRAYRQIIDIQSQQKHWDDAATATASMAEIANSDESREGDLLDLAELYAKGGHVDQAVKTLIDLAGQYAYDDDLHVTTELHAATLLLHDKQNAPAAEHYNNALKLLDPDDDQTPDVLWNLSSCLTAANDLPGAVDAVQKLTDPRYEDSPHWANREAHERLITLLVKTNQAAAAADMLKGWETTDPDSSFRTRWCMRNGEIARAAGDRAGALAAYRRIFTEHCQDPVSDNWYAAQTAITEILVDSGDKNGALRSAHVLLDAAPDITAINSAVKRISDLLQAIDGKATRAKAFTDYEHQGMGLKAAKGGGGGGANPLDHFEYPDDPERIAAFAAAFPNLGDDSAAAFHRAQMLVYIGQPRRALDFYVDACRRASWDDWTARATALLFNSLRPVRGNLVGIDAAARFLLYGPAGPDGTAGTSDDLTNPFINLPAAPTSQSISTWAVVNAPNSNDASIEALQSSLRNILSADGLPDDVRQAAMGAIARAIEIKPAPDDLQLAGELINFGSPNTRDSAMSLALSIARGNTLDVAGARSLLASDHLSQAAQRRAEKAFNTATKSFEHWSKGMFR